MIKSPVLFCRVLLFVFAFLFVLLHCTLSVRADGGGGDAAQLVEITPGKEMDETAKGAEAIGNNVMTFFDEFDKNVDEIKNALNDVSREIKRKKTKLQEEIEKIIGKEDNMFDELEKSVKETADKLNELKELKAAMMGTEPEKIKEKVNELVIKREELKTAVRRPEGDKSGGGGEKGGAVVQKTKELQSAADAVKNIMEEIFNKTHEQNNVVLRVIDIINDTTFEIDKTINSLSDETNKKYEEIKKKEIDEIKKLKDNEAENNKEEKAKKIYEYVKKADNEITTLIKINAEVKKVLGSDVQKSLFDISQKAKEMSLHLEHARCDAKIVVDFCEKLKNSAEGATAAKGENDGENIVRAQFFSFATAAVWLFYVSFLFFIIPLCV